MKKSLRKIIIAIFVCLLFIKMPFFLYADVKKPSVVADPLVSENEGENFLFDSIDSYALRQLKNYLPSTDYDTLVDLLLKVQNGDTEAKNLIKLLLKDYSPNSEELISQYLINDKNIKLDALYFVEKGTYALGYVPIQCFTDREENEYVRNIKTALWTEALAIFPNEMLDNISNIAIEENKSRENLITISHTSDFKTWALSFDVLAVTDTNDLRDALIQAVAYYYILNNKQTEPSASKNNYVYDGMTYADKSYINIFYKKFWKGRRKEWNVNQKTLYEKDFINAKASRTVYDDMAVSFTEYVKHGIAYRYLGFRADKQNFFDDYEFFRNLASEIRKNIGIIIY